MDIVRNIAELDRKIMECDAAERVSDDAMRAVFGSFCMDPPAHLTTMDPFSVEYRRAQLALYEEITGRSYSDGEEITKFDIRAALRRPFPFTTGSSATAGEYFMAIGFVLKTMALPPNSRILEFGPGWGFTSLWLAQLGHRVTVVDIEPCFCELIAQRAERENVSIEIVNGNFFWTESVDRTFDAVLFYDCFHHCDDHERLLRALVRIVAADGRIFFGAEPIIPDFPLPWGLRLDGWSLWGIRKNGWMELGFRDDYFAQILERTGWFGRKIAIEGADRLRVWEARHRESVRFFYAADDARLHTQVGTRRGGRIVIENAPAGTAIFGPYIDLPPGRYEAKIVFSAPVQGQAVIDVSSRHGQDVLSRAMVKGAEGRLTFQVSQPISGVEVRLFSHKGLTAIVDHVEIGLATD